MKLTKKIKKKDLNDLISSIFAINSDGAKNIISYRSEKISKEINEISKKLNSEISDIDEEYASTDKDHNLLREEVVTSDKQGVSKKENSGKFKYTFRKSKDRKTAIENFWNEEVDIPCNIVKREHHEELYKKVLKENTFSTLSNLAGIILDIPVGEDGFIDEKWILDFLSEDKKVESNGKTDNPKLEATTAEGR